MEMYERQQLEARHGLEVDGAVAAVRAQQRALVEALEVVHHLRVIVLAVVPPRLLRPLLVRLPLIIPRLTHSDCELQTASFIASYP